MAKKTQEAASQEEVANEKEMKTQEAASQEEAANGDENSGAVESDEPVVKVKFLKSPTGAFGLAYAAGDETNVSVSLAEKMIDSGFASRID
jgi:hypothetical protein